MKRREYKIVNEDNEVFKVICVENEETWGEGYSVKGAVIGALISGIQLRNIDFNGHYVPIQECLDVVM